MSNLQTVMRKLEARDQAERDANLPSAQRMRALVPEAGKFIYLIIRACNYRRVLEIGTSYGYSTLWLASAAQAIGGHVDTIEISSERVAAARENFDHAGLADVITQHQGDAKPFLSQLPGGYDFIFIDAEKDDYEDYLDLTLDKVVRGGIIMADNVLSHADQLGHYIEKAQHTDGLLSVTVPIGRGEEVSLRGERGLPAPVVATMAELEVYAKSHDNAWNVPRAVGKFLRLLAIGMKAQSVVEIGTSTGYSGLWLASAMQDTGGRVLTIEADPAKVKVAQEAFAKAKVTAQISIATGKALDVLPTISNPVDFAFVDAAKEEYLAYVDALWPKLKPWGLILADNVLSHKDVLGSYSAQLQARTDALSVTLPLGSGMEFSMKLPTSNSQTPS